MRTPPVPGISSPTSGFGSQKVDQFLPLLLGKELRRLLGEEWCLGDGLHIMPVTQWGIWFARTQMSTAIQAPDADTVRRMRPDHPWDDVVRVLNQKGPSWTPERLMRAVKWFVTEHLADAVLLKKSPPRLPEDRLMTLIAGISGSNSELSLRDIAAQFERLHERTPRGSAKWSASSVKNLLDRARAIGLVEKHAPE